ncbi:MAG: oligosaccharide flippase family protein [Deltaproteobacteria bacterium]|jgi:O-antigen/teichoic acid export membrane protein|nr:oligosaccharide flippase family protein [Deltaproteobacteria bacterium]
MIRLKSIPQRLGYVLCAQWTRDIAWTAFTILLARHSQIILGQIMLALSLGYLVRMAVDAGMNEFLLSSFARRDSRPLSLLGEITWFKLGLLALALLVSWIITGILGYEFRLRIMALAIAGGLGMDAVTDSFFALCQARGRQDVEMRIRVPAGLIGIGYGIVCTFADTGPIWLALYKPIESSILMLFALKALDRNPLGSFSIERLRQLGQRLKLGVIFTCMAFCSMFYNKLNVFFLKTHGGNAQVGSYSVAWETVDGISTLVSGALLGKVIFPMLTKLWHENAEEFRKLAGQTARSLWAVALPVMYLLFVESDRILVFIYGPHYADASLTQRLLTPCVATAFLHNLAAYAMISMHRQRLLLWCYVSGLAANLLLCILLIPAFKLEGAALALTLTKVWVAVLTIGFFQHTARPMNSRQWLLLIGAACAAFGLWRGLGPYLPRELTELAGLVPLLALLWRWRPPTPWEKKKTDAQP